MLRTSQYVVRKSYFGDVWDFGKRQNDDESDLDAFLLFPPGMCLEGVRVRSTAAGYERADSTPWVFVNLTGRDAPKTNVARSDIEQTPELERALFRTYSLLGGHVQREFDRLLEKGTGIVEAAWEAEYIIKWGLEGNLTNLLKFEEAMADLKIIAVEDDKVCRAVTERDFRSFKAIWTVDSRLSRNIEGIAGTLGIDLPAEKIIQAIGKEIKPAIPLPRLLGRSTRSLRGLEVSSFRIYPEERSHRIDMCWEERKEGGWIVLAQRVMEQTILRLRRGYVKINIARDKAVSAECPSYDAVKWRNEWFIFATSGIADLFEVFGQTNEYARWLILLIEHGEIPIDQRPLLREKLEAANAMNGAELLSRLVFPFERRYGDHRGSDRESHFFRIDD